MTAILAPIGSMLFSFGFVLILIAGWMRLCDSGSDLAGRVLWASVLLLAAGTVMIF